MAQVLAPGAQLSVASSHVSVPLHATASAQKFRAALPAQTPPEQTSPVVQNAPSSQLAPSFGLHALREVPTAQTSHGLIGFTCPAP